MESLKRHGFRHPSEVDDIIRRATCTTRQADGAEISLVEEQLLNDDRSCNWDIG